MGKRRRDVITTGVGMSAFGTGAAMRHTALERAYEGGPRPRLAQELKFMAKRTKGRKLYAGGAALGTLAVAPAGVGLNNLIRKEPASKAHHTNIYQDTTDGIGSALAARGKTIANPAPVHRQAQSLAVGGLVASSTSGLAHLAMHKAPKRLQGLKAGTAAVTGLSAGIVSLPVQSKLMQRTSHGAYQVTPTGVTRTKTPRVNASRKATKVERRGGVELAVRKAQAREANGRWTGGQTAGVGAIAAGSLSAVGLLASRGRRVSPAPVKVALRAKMASRGTRTDFAQAYSPGTHQVPIGHLKNITDGHPRKAERLGTVQDSIARNGMRKPLEVRTHGGQAYLVNGHHRLEIGRNLKMRTVPVSVKRGRWYQASDKVTDDRWWNDTSQWAVKKDYPGADLTNGQKRRRVLAAGSAPIVGDFAAAGLAGRMAPPELRKKTTALQLGGSTGGSLVGGTAGAYGLARLARIKAVRTSADKVGSGLDKAKSSAAHKVNPALGAKVDAAQARGGKVERGIGKLVAHKRPGIARAGRVLARARKPLTGVGYAAAVGAMGGQALGSTAVGSLTYGHALKLEDKLHKSTDNRKGSGRVSKADKVTGMGVAQEQRQLKRRHRAVALGATSSAAGLVGMGTLGAAGLPRLKPVRAQLLRTATGATIVSGGLGGLAGMRSANLATRDIKSRQKVLAKSYFPGIGYKPVTQMAPTIRSAMKDRLKPKPTGFRLRAQQVGDKLAGHDAPNRGSQGIGLHKRPAAPSSTGRQIWGHQPTAHLGGKTVVERHAGQLPHQVLDRPNSTGGTFRAMADAAPNGRGGGVVRVRDPKGTAAEGLDKEVMAHEMAHIKPRRNVHTFQQRTKNQFRDGREEGRADMAAGRHNYPGTPEFRSGYEDSQRKIALAQAYRGVTKALVPGAPRVRPVRLGRAGSTRSGYLRQTRTAAGPRTVSVRGGYG